MSDEELSVLSLEQICVDRFGQRLNVSHLVASRLPVSQTDYATIFLTDKKLMFVYIAARTRQTIGHVTKIIAKMGLDSELIVPPKNQPNYFDDFGFQEFKKIFPGRTNVTKDDIRYYRTLAPYNPALVQIREIKNGIIHQFDSDARSGWRPSIKLTYRRIKAS